MCLSHNERKLHLSKAAAREFVDAEGEEARMRFEQVLWGGDVCGTCVRQRLKSGKLGKKYIYEINLLQVET